MKKYMLIALVAIIANTAQAQTTEATQPAKKEMKSPDERAEHRAKKMTEKYKLDDQQSARVLELNREKMINDEKLRQQEKTTQTVRKDIHKQRKAQHDAYLDALREIMTPDQFAAFEADAAARKAKNKEKRQARKNDGQ